jgi:hypothetical protein
MRKKSRFASPSASVAATSPMRRKGNIIDVLEGLMACFIVFMFGALTSLSLMMQPGLAFKAAGVLVAAMDLSVIVIIAKKYLWAR